MAVGRGFLPTYVVRQRHMARRAIDSRRSTGRPRMPFFPFLARRESWRVLARTPCPACGDGASLGCVIAGVTRGVWVASLGVKPGESCVPGCASGTADIKIHLSNSEGISTTQTSAPYYGASTSQPRPLHYGASDLHRWRENMHFCIAVGECFSSKKYCAGCIFAFAWRC